MKLQLLAWYEQVLRRFNEAIALDYVIPFCPEEFGDSN